MPATAREVLNHEHRGATLEARFRREIPGLDVVRARQWLWPEAFVGKLDSWLRKAEGEKLAIEAKRAYAAKAGVHTGPAPIVKREPTQAAQWAKGRGALRWSYIQKLALEAGEVVPHYSESIGSDWFRWVTQEGGPIRDRAHELADAEWEAKHGPEPRQVAS
jgi:hypothetical protein